MKTAPAERGPHPRLIVDLGAIRANYAQLQSIAPGAAVGAVVKADAYGLGVDRVGPALVEAGCRHFFVASTREGAELRDVIGDGPDIVVFNGFWMPDIETLRNGSLIPAVNDPDQFAALEAHAPDLPFSLHVDTGMNRLGLEPDDAIAIAGRAQSLDLRLVMSHLACADEPDHALNETQRREFNRVRAAYPGVKASLANSAGTLLGPDYQNDVVRPGIALYGGAPCPDGENPFTPAAAIEAPILQVRDIHPGDAVGYGATFTSGEARKAAIVACGYADGLFRAAQDGGFAMLGDQHLPVMGRISMDLTTLDVTGAGDAARPGAYVRFMGSELEALASASGTISYELLVRLGRRFERVYVG